MTVIFYKYMIGRAQYPVSMDIKAMMLPEVCAGKVQRLSREIHCLIAHPACKTLEAGNSIAEEGNDCSA